MTAKLDKKDWKILEILCKDARCSHNQIGKKVSLSKNAVTYRIERLKKKGIIEGFFTIINQNAIGIRFCVLLLKTNSIKENEQDLIKFLKEHPNTAVIDEISGKWNYLIEFGFQIIDNYYDFLNELKNKFSNIIDTYEVHPILTQYEAEQLPIELMKKDRQILELKKSEKTIKIDKKDRKILFELNKDSSISLINLAKKTNLTAETVATRIKKLKLKNVIIKFTAKISLKKLGYDLYLISFGIRNLSREKEEKLKSYITVKRRIRYAFMSASNPRLFVYLAVKDIDELDTFLTEIWEKFTENITKQRYLLIKDQYKYELFPEGFLKEA